MNKRYTIAVAALAFFAGILLFLVQYEWIIFRFWQPVSPISNLQFRKKKCHLAYWHNDRWHTEKEELLWASDDATNIATIITAWLSLLDADDITRKKISLESALKSPNGTDIFLSFDRNPFNKEWSIKQKIMFIEGLLKTVRDAEIAVQTVRFLVHHKSFTDQHLDFSFGWPCNGFTNSQLQ